jgi:hypothetical protein
MVAVPQKLPGGGWGFWLEADALGMPDTLPATEQRRYLMRAGAVAADVWKRYRARGLDATGTAMKPIHQLTRQARAANINPVTGKAPYSPQGVADPSAAPLQATGSKSRTQSLLRFAVKPPRGVWFYWAYDRSISHYWGEILAYHRTGFARFFVWPRGGWGWVSGRDVFGFSKDEMGEIREAMAGWLRPPRTTPGIIEQIRRGKPVEIRPRWVSKPEWQEIGVMGPTIILPPEPRQPVPVRVQAPSPQFAARWAQKLQRIPVPLRDRLIMPVGRALADVLSEVNWYYLRRTALWVLLVEFVRSAVWPEVLDLFASMGWTEPKDREDAERMLTARAEGNAA